MAKTDLTSLKESRDFLREMNIEMDRYNSKVKDADTLQGKITKDTETQVNAAIRLREANSLSAKGLSDVVELSKRIQTQDIDITESKRLQSDLQAKLEKAIESGHTKAERALRTQLGMLTGMDKRLETEEEVQKKLKGQEELVSGIDDLTGGLATQAKNFGEALKTPIGGAFAILALVVGLFASIAAQTDEIGENFGSIGTTQFRNDIVGATAEAQRLGFEVGDVSSSVGELSSNFGLSFKDSLKLSESTMDTARALGIGADESAKLTGMLMTIAGHSETSSQNFMKQAEALATSAGVAPGVVLKDMAGSSEDIAKFTQGSGENMVRAAISARKMGLTLSEVAGVAENLLDFQSSLQSEMEASAIIGRQLNLQRARELALAGDLEGMQSEILNIVGSEAEFNRMNVIQRKALAGALGLEVSQLAKMVSHAGKSRKELMGMSDVSLDQIASEKAIGDMTRFTNEMRAAGTELIGLIAGIANLGGVFGELSAVQKLSTLIIIAAISYIGIYALKTMIQIGLNRALAKSEEKVNQARKKGPQRGLFERIFGKNTKPSRIIAGSVALVIMSVAVLIAAKAFQQFNTVNWESVLFGLGTLVVMGFVAKMLSKGSKEMIIGAFAIALLGAALIPAAYAFSLLAGVDPLSILAFSASLIVLGAAVFGLGALMFTGIGALVFGAGILALLALGGAVLLLGFGLTMAAPHLQSFSAWIAGLAETMTIITPNIPSIHALGSALSTLTLPLTQLGMSGYLTSPGLNMLATAGINLREGFQGFVEAMTGVPEILGKLSMIDSTGIYSLSGALSVLATSLMLVGAASVFAAPAMAAVITSAVALSALGLLGEGGTEGGGESSEFEEMKTSLKNMETKMGLLLAGFQDGSFADTIGKATGKNTSNIKAEIKPSLL